ncbi:MAG: diaminopimelate epimerase [Acidimicrobiales bacterium]
MRLQKYQALGNDFLILLDVEGAQPIDADLARAVCHRHKGAGADGLIRVTAGGPAVEGADVTMELRNADGSRAETSGNGLRCVARAVVDAGVVAGPWVVVATDAGHRRASLGEGDLVAVEMGVARVEPLPAEFSAPAQGAARAQSPAQGAARAQAGVAVDLGNPHLVLLDDGTSELEALGRTYPTTNVELITAGPGAGELTMRVWERGVGETEACGSGACAAAAAAAGWGLVGERTVVHQRGGDVVVDLAGDTIVLTGPAQSVCVVELPEGTR